MMTLVLIWATMGLGWNMLSGYSGMISFGHAAFFGLGAYTVTIAFVKFGITPWLGIPLGVLVGVIAGVLIGVPTFRLRGHYFALSMLAYPLAMLYVFEWMGFQEVSLPMMREHPDHFYAQFNDPRAYMAISMVVMVALHAHLAPCREFTLRTLIARDQAESAGRGSRRHQRASLEDARDDAAGMAAAAGGLYAIVLLVVTPQTMFGALISAQALIFTLFGGIGIFWGPVIGSTILFSLAETLNAELSDILPGIQGVVYGIAVIVIILVAPEGVFWRVRDRVRARRGPCVVDAHLASLNKLLSRRQLVPAHLGRPLLQLDSVSRSFGGLRAVDDVTLTSRKGRSTALSVRTAPARRRCSMSSTAFLRRTPAA